MITLQPFNIENARIHFEWNNDKELNFYDSDYPHHLESYESFIHRVKAVLISGETDYKWFEVHTGGENPKLIGIVDIYNIDRYNMRCELNCSIGNRSYRNKGFGGEALQQAVAYCFETLGMHKVTTYAFDFNEKWVHLTQKAGFRQDGVLRNHSYKEDGYHDKFILSLLKPEYEQMKETGYAVSETG